MTNIDINYSERRLIINGKEFILEHVIYKAFQLDDKIIVLYNSSAYWKEYGKPQTGQFHSLVAYDVDGNKLWTAELPTTDPVESYDWIFSQEPLVVGSWTGYHCTINPANGKIVSKVYRRD